MPVYRGYRRQRLYNFFRSGRHISIDNSHRNRYIAGVESRSLKGHRPVTPADWSECGTRGRRLVTAAPGRSRASARRHYDLHARCVAATGPALRGEPPPVSASRPEKHGLRLSLRDEILPWARAVVERRKACAPCKARAAPRGAEVGTQRLSGVPLPLFCSFEVCRVGGAKRNPPNSLQSNDRDGRRYHRRGHLTKIRVLRFVRGTGLAKLRRKKRVARTWLLISCAKKLKIDTFFGGRHDASWKTLCLIRTDWQRSDL